jgi:hypothetical protein
LFFTLHSFRKLLYLIDGLLCCLLSFVCVSRC